MTDADASSAYWRRVGSVAPTEANTTVASNPERAAWREAETRSCDWTVRVMGRMMRALLQWVAGGPETREGCGVRRPLESCVRHRSRSGLLEMDAWV